MEPTPGFITTFTPIGRLPEETRINLLQFRDEFMSLPPETSSSFTALLELPATPAMELLHSPEFIRDPTTAKLPAHSLNSSVNSLHFQPLDDNLTFPSDRLTVERVANLPAFTGEKYMETTSSLPSNSNAELENVKNELIMELDESKLLVSDPTAENSNQRPAKRKDREKKGKGSTKKSKKESPEGAEKLPYVHVRARRGQATDSHSLAERARREKINARMKLLQDLVPGCSKISGTALVLDEIINHVQSLQRQVEFLSMRLATVNPSIDFNVDTILGAESEYAMDGNFSNMASASMWPDVLVEEEACQFDRVHQAGRESWEESQELIPPGNSFLTPAHSGKH